MLCMGSSTSSYGKEAIRRAEGPRAVEKKTPFDLMILRICGHLGVAHAPADAMFARVFYNSPRSRAARASYLVVPPFHSTGEIQTPRVGSWP